MLYRTDHVSVLVRGALPIPVLKLPRSMYHLALIMKKESHLSERIGKPFEITGSSLEGTRPDLRIFLIKCRRSGLPTCNVFTPSLFRKLLGKLELFLFIYFFKENLLSIMQGTSPSCKGEDDKLISLRKEIVRAAHWDHSDLAPTWKPRQHHTNIRVKSNKLTLM